MLWTVCQSEWSTIFFSQDTPLSSTRLQDGRRAERDGSQKDGGARAPRAAIAGQEEEGLHDSGEEEETEGEH